MHMNQIDIKGKYWDQLITATGEVVDYGWRSNIIVNQCRQLLAAFMKGETASGIQRIALGRGEEVWDVESPPSPEMTTDRLVDPSPQIITTGAPEMELEFLNGAGEVSSTVSQSIQITINIAAGSLPIAVGEDSFPLREFGLFADLAADEFMIDYVRHPVMNIGPEDTLVRRVRLFF